MVLIMIRRKNDALKLRSGHLLEGPTRYGSRGQADPGSSNVLFASASLIEAIEVAIGEQRAWLI